MGKVKHTPSTHSAVEHVEARGQSAAEAQPVRVGHVSGELAQVGSSQRPPTHSDAPESPEPGHSTVMQARSKRMTMRMS